MSMKRLLFSIGILLALNGCISDDYIDNSDKNIDVIAKTLVNEESFD